jgi:hypothetical protein
VSLPGKESDGPTGDAARHRPFAELETHLRALPVLPCDTGSVSLIVRRRADGARETLERTRLTLEEGVLRGTAGAGVRRATRRPSSR